MSFRRRLISCTRRAALPPTEMPEEEALGRGWQYLGVGCLTAAGGFFGGGIIAVMLAKIVGAFTGCAPDNETGAPCNWYYYAIAGALVGVVLLPSFAIIRLRQSRTDSRNSERG